MWFFCEKKSDGSLKKKYCSSASINAIVYYSLTQGWIKLVSKFRSILSTYDILSIPEEKKAYIIRSIYKQFCNNISLDKILHLWN